MTWMGRLLHELETFDGAGAPVLSLYLPVKSDEETDLLTRTTRLVRPLARDMSEAAQADLARELDVVRDYVGSLVAAPSGLAIFCCSRRGFFRVARLGEHVREYAGWRPEPETGPLRAIAERAGLLTPVA